MKKIINSPPEAVKEMVRAMSLAHPNLKVLDGTTVVVRRDAPVPGKVGLVTGGGSGHEPAHAGYVGRGMLDAACAGNVFTSPPLMQIVEGIKAANSGHGVLLIVKNYTGDIVNFGLAAEMAAEEGIATRTVVVKDDVAVKEESSNTGRRGVAGTVFVHKIAGAKAEAGASLDEVAAVAERVTANVRSMGLALTPCTIPEVGKPNFQIGEEEIELGIGIHGEPGVSRQPLIPSRQIAQTLVDHLLAEFPGGTGDKLAVVVNGMGATPLMELYLLYGDVADVLAKKGFILVRSYVGEYMTSLEMAGASVTLLRLDEELTRLLDAPAATPGWVQP